MRENRNLVVAAAILVAVGVLFYFFDLKGPAKAPTTSPTPQPSPVLGLAPSQIQQVVIHSKSKVLTLALANSTWTYSLCNEGVAPCAASTADATPSAQVFQSLAALRPSKVIFGAPEGLPAYGVDKPTTAEIDVKGSTNQQVTIIVGGKSPDSSSYFLRRQDSNDILAVAVGSIDALLAFVDKPPVPQPTASPGAAAPATPSAAPVGPVPASP
ncbi:MAG: hypothetical protein QOK05_1632 [Chloroflexota bacterium]|nr:hypothetical protein [Chloroflexota bacterium]